MIVDVKNMVREHLVTRKEIILPLLHIKLGLMKQFKETIDKEGQC